jgi:hypothetical protein
VLRGCGTIWDFNTCRGDDVLARLGSRHRDDPTPCRSSGVPERLRSGGLLMAKVAVIQMRRVFAVLGSRRVWK